ncbi:MAG: hypothetical protein AVDCRST_MAG26-2435, partial [uncultured Chloroflexia bacterium]
CRSDPPSLSAIRRSCPRTGVIRLLHSHSRRASLRRRACPKIRRRRSSPPWAIPCHRHSRLGIHRIQAGTSRS